MGVVNNRNDSDTHFVDIISDTSPTLWQLRQQNCFHFLSVGLPYQTLFKLKGNGFRQPTLFGNQVFVGAKALFGAPYISCVLQIFAQQTLNLEDLCSPTLLGSLQICCSFLRIEWKYSRNSYKGGMQSLDLWHLRRSTKNSLSGAPCHYVKFGFVSRVRKGVPCNGPGKRNWMYLTKFSSQSPSKHPIQAHDAIEGMPVQNLSSLFDGWLKKVFLVEKIPARPASHFFLRFTPITFWWSDSRAPLFSCRAGVSSVLKMSHTKLCISALDY